MNVKRNLIKEREESTENDQDQYHGTSSKGHKSTKADGE